MTLEVEGSGQVVVSRDEIESRTWPASGMPPIGLALSPAALRDVVAYVMTLE